jgi:hypothetical protein
MRFSCLFQALLLLTCMPADAVSPQQLLERLYIDHAAMVAAERDFRSSRARGTLAGNEAADYAAWVARLHRQVAEDCAVLAGHGIPAPEELSCPVAVAAFIAPAPIDQVAEQTSAEKTAVLDAELRTGMGEFDEMLLQEQERIKAATPYTSDSSGQGGGQGGGADGGGATGGTGQQATDNADGSADGSSGQQQGAGPGKPQHTARAGTPADIPDGSDDDVVARQLREAAEKEADPELKKKLWEEYRKYKKGIR